MSTKRGQGQPEDRGPEPRIDNSHISQHWVQGNAGTHPIAQKIEVDGQSMISYTDVDANGNVSNSGFDKKV